TLHGRRLYERTTVRSAGEPRGKGDCAAVPRPSRPDGRTPRRVTSSGGRESRFNRQVCEARNVFRLEPREVKAGGAPHVAMSPRKLVTATNCGADVGFVLHCGFCSRLVAG